MVKLLDPVVVEEVYGIMRDGYAKLREGNVAAAESSFMAAWKRIPDPQVFMGY